MPRRKFSDEEKLKILQQSLETEDIRDLLRQEGIHRRHVANIAQEFFNSGKIDQKQFQSICERIERPRAFPTDTEQRLEALLAGVM
ncbi:MAG: hypothetical protein QMD14_02955, partial [Candidatus Aenigmarchaeota archaeon]|nr:hypothetical protein [Candidatus Aenigmarchaeota archaeon]